MAVSDRPFKLVHANPRMVEDVVRVVAPQWAHRLDYAALTAVDKEYVAASSATARRCRRSSRTRSGGHR